MSSPNRIALVPVFAINLCVYFSLCLILTYVFTSPIFQLVIVTQTVKVVYQQRLILSVAGVESSTNVPTAWIGSDRNGSTLDAQNM